MEVGMTREQKVAERLGLNHITEKTANQLLKVLYAVEDEQGYENKDISAAINFLQGTDSREEKPTVYFESRHESGNIFALLGKVHSALKDKDEFNALWTEIQKGSYEQAVKLIKEKVILIDLDGIY